MLYGSKDIILYQPNINRYQIKAEDDILVKHFKS